MRATTEAAPPRTPLIRGVVAISVALLLAGCGLRLPPSEPEPPPGAIETRLFLLGDAGGATADDPVMVALRRELAKDPVRSIAVFLGDNIYPAGMPPEGAPGRAAAERRLSAQIAAVRESGARAVFVPGNHDWGGIDGSPDGWQRVRRQAEYIDEHGGPVTVLAPEPGCPGPYVRDVERRLRLVVLDSHWWLHPFEKPRSDSACTYDTEAEVVAGLESFIDSAGERHVVVAAHHPLASGGEHGGYFSWTDHLFPLRATRSWLWIPLPVIGSIYPTARQRGITSQDLSGVLNRRFREAIEGVFQRTPPLVYAAGHEHNLQILEGRDVGWLLVSGAGYWNHTSRVVVTPATRYAEEASGFMVIEVPREGPPRLVVLTVDASGTTRERWSGRLVPNGGAES